MKKYDELMNDALEMLKNDDDLYCECVDELDSWNGYADGFRAYDMWELDDLHCGMSLHEFLDKLTDDFNIRDNYFYYSICGLESTDYKAELYRDNTDEGEVLDEVIDKWNHLNICNSEFSDLIDEIINYEEDEETA